MSYFCYYVLWNHPIFFQKYIHVPLQNIQLHSMDHVGHWIHAEDLPGMLDVIEKGSKHKL